MFRLWAWDGSRPQSPPELALNVIVGRAWKTQTPLLEGRMTAVVFRPYWNVPASIVQGEILPKLQRDPAYLQKEQMELVVGTGIRERPVPLSPAAIEQLRRGEVRIRQRPGARNALGLIKFVFPNSADVYLHGTPQQALFQKARRDFSHGCVRVEDPVALAEWVLTDNGNWPRERIIRAMDGPSSQTIAPVRGVHVILFYTTAAMMPDGTMQFAEDVYGFDGKLERALAAAKCMRARSGAGFEASAPTESPVSETGDSQKRILPLIGEAEMSHEANTTDSVCNRLLDRVTGRVSDGAQPREVVERAVDDHLRAPAGRHRSRSVHQRRDL